MKTNEKPVPDEVSFKKTGRLILIRVLLVPILIMTLVSGILIYYFSSYSRSQVRNELSRTASAHRYLIDRFFEDRIGDLRLMTALYSPEELSKPGILKKVFEKLRKKSGAFHDLGVFDKNGRHIAYEGPYNLAGKNYSQTDWFRAVSRKGLYISDEFLGYRNIPHFIIAVRQTNSGGDWYLRATIDTYYFNHLVEGIRIRKTGEAYIVNTEGLLQTCRKAGGEIMKTDPDFGDYSAGISDSPTFTTGGSGLDKYLYAVEPLKHTSWLMVVRQDMLDAYSPLIVSTLVSVFILLGGGAVVVLMGYILASGVASSLSMMKMEKRQMKTQLIIAGKLAEIGEMSTGIAHEINNPLQVMKAEVALLKDHIGDFFPPENGFSEKADRLNDSVDEIAGQINRCGKITQGLLGFARNTENIVRPLRLQKLIPDVVSMVEQRALVENIRIVQELDQDLPEIESDSGQLQQVFLNLLNNAIYALKEKGSGGEIRIIAGQKDSGVVVSVGDNGCGFAPEDIEKAFLPFFTTKPVGEGTGLGLSITYGIVRGLGGDISLTSEQDAGSVFTIALPLKLKKQEKNH